MSKQFKVSLGTAVLTSNYVITGNSPIVYVAHHEDGTWEFWSKEIIDESEIMVVALRDMIKIDSTILEIADLPPEFNAIRESKKDTWKIVPKN